MAKPKLTTTFLVTVEHDKPLPDLLDLVAGRAYTIDGVTNAEAKLMDDVLRDVAAKPVVTVNSTWRHKKTGGEYQVLAFACLQAHRNVLDDQPAVAYRKLGDNTAPVWVRPRDEFEDGRFEFVSQ
jgi:hypothetical protein